MTIEVSVLDQLVCDAKECLDDIETLAWKMPLDELLDYARDNGLDHIAAELIEFAAVKSILVNLGPQTMTALLKHIEAGKSQTP